MILSGAALNSTAINGWPSLTAYVAAASSQGQYALAQAGSSAQSPLTAVSQAQQAQATLDQTAFTAAASSQVQWPQAGASLTAYASAVSSQSSQSGQATTSRAIFSSDPVGSIPWSGINASAVNAATDAAASAQTQKSFAQAERASQAITISSQAQFSQMDVAAAVPATVASGQSAQTANFSMGRSCLFHINSEHLQSGQSALTRSLAAAINGYQTENSSGKIDLSIQALISSKQAHSHESLLNRFLDTKTTTTQSQTTQSSIKRIVYSIDTAYEITWPAQDGTSENHISSQGQSAYAHTNLFTQTIFIVDQIQSAHILFESIIFPSANSEQTQQPFILSLGEQLSKIESNSIQFNQAAANRTTTCNQSEFDPDTPSNEKTESRRPNQAQNSLGQLVLAIDITLESNQTQNNSTLLIGNLYGLSSSNESQTALTRFDLDSFLSEESSQGQQAYANIIRISISPSFLYAIVPPVKNVAYVPATVSSISNL